MPDTYRQIEITNWKKYNPREDVKHSSWFRMNHRFFFDPDLTHVSAEEKYVYLTLLAMASAYDKKAYRFDVPTIAANAKVREETVLTSVSKFEELGALHVSEVALASIHPLFQETSEEGAENDAVALTNDAPHLHCNDAVVSCDDAPALNDDADCLNSVDALALNHAAPALNCLDTPHLNNNAPNLNHNDAVVSSHNAGHLNRFAAPALNCDDAVVSSPVLDPTIPRAPHLTVGEADFSHVTETSRKRSTTRRNVTNLRISVLSDNKTLEPFDFERIYKIFPKRGLNKDMRKTLGMKRLKAQIKSEEKYQSFLKAVENYAEYVKQEKARDPNWCYGKMWGTFCAATCWVDWIEVEKPTRPREKTLEEAIAEADEWLNRQGVNHA